MDGTTRRTFGRHLRVVRKGDFERAYKRGARARGAILVVVAVPNELPHPRLGLSVGRAIWRSAVKRNRVRRIFREAFRLEQAALPAGMDLVLIPARAELDPKLAETREELVALAAKAARKFAERNRRSEAAP